MKKMNICTSCGEEFSGSPHLACGVCGNGLCDECYENELDTEVTQNPFGGYELFDQEMEWIDEAYPYDLICYDCAERIANEAMAKFRKQLRAK